ncbi:MAG: hypothetical protein MUE69_07210, partial [Myxococcota bacterium]|nr:hypothetical protein [Myxococcota bacterium]
ASRSAGSAADEASAVDSEDARGADVVPAPRGSCEAASSHAPSESHTHAITHRSDAAAPDTEGRSRTST